MKKTLTKKEIFATAKSKTDFPEGHTINWIALMPVRSENGKYFKDTYVDSKAWGLFMYTQEVNADGSEIPPTLAYGQAAPVSTMGLLNSDSFSKEYVYKISGDILEEVKSTKVANPSDYDLIIQKEDEKENERVKKMRLFLEQTNKC